MSYHYDKDTKQYILSRQGSGNDLYPSKPSTSINHSPQIFRVVSKSRMASLEQIAQEAETIKAGFTVAVQEKKSYDIVSQESTTPIKNPTLEHYARTVTKPATSITHSVVSTPSTSYGHTYNHDSQNSSLESSRAETPRRQTVDSVSTSHTLINSVRLSEDCSGFRSRVRLITASNRQSPVKNLQQAPEASKPNLQQKVQATVVQPIKQTFEQPRRQLEIRSQVVKPATGIEQSQSKELARETDTKQPTQKIVKQSKIVMTIREANERQVTSNPHRKQTNHGDLLRKYRLIEPSSLATASTNDSKNQTKSFFSSNDHIKFEQKRQEIPNESISKNQQVQISQVSSGAAQQTRANQKETQNIQQTPHQSPITLPHQTPPIHQTHNNQTTNKTNLINSTQPKPKVTQNTSCNTDHHFCHQCVTLKFQTEKLKQQLSLKQTRIQQKSLEINNLQKMLKNTKTQNAEADRFRQTIHQIIHQFNRPYQKTDILQQLRSVMSELDCQSKQLSRYQASLQRANTEINQIKQHSLSISLQSQHNINKLHEQLYILDQEYIKLQKQTQVELQQHIQQIETQRQQIEMQRQQIQKLQQLQQPLPTSHQLQQIKQELESQRIKSEQYLADFNSLLSFYTERTKQLESAETNQQIEELKNKQRISQLEAKIETFEMQLEEIEEQDAGTIRMLKRELAELRKKWNSHLSQITEQSLKEYILEVRILNTKLTDRQQQIFELKEKALQSQSRATQFKNLIELERTKANQARNALQAQHQQEIQQLYEKLYERQRMVESLMDKLGLTAEQGQGLRRYSSLSTLYSATDNSVNLTKSIQKDFKRIAELEQNNRMLARQLSRLSALK